MTLQVFFICLELTSLSDLIHNILRLNAQQACFCVEAIFVIFVFALEVNDDNYFKVLLFLTCNPTIIMNST